MLKRYAACTTEEEVKKAEEIWLDKIEREYAQSRADRDAGATDDPWKGGNLNQKDVMDSDDEEDAEGSGSDDEDEEDGGVVTYNVAMPEDDEDDEEEMAELRRKVLASKPFNQPADTGQKASTRQPEAESVPLEDSDAESGSDDDHAEFDDIINATPVTDRIGIAARERSRKLETASATFSRGVVTAPRKW